MNSRVAAVRDITTRLYDEGFVQTVYNTQSKKHQENGWTLKNGLWSPWFLNLRPLGNSPKLANDIACEMNRMIRERIPQVTRIVGVEMAGVPLASAIGIQGRSFASTFIPYAYTRPFPDGFKPRSPEEALSHLEEMKADFGYGQKELVEGNLRVGDILCITDDMVTNFGSKLIARHIIEYELDRREIERDYVSVDDAAVVLDREQGGEQEAKKNGMRLYSLIKFKTQGLEWLEGSMHPKEFALVSDYQQNPDKYQNPEMQKEVLARAHSLRR